MSRQRAMVSQLEYREAGGKEHARLHLVETGQRSREETGALEEMRRELERAREVSAAELEDRVRREVEAERTSMMRQVQAALKRFDEERGRYFAGAEQEVVQLSLGIARKILQREAELDPTLLAALVRIALERMEGGTNVRVRVPPAEAGRWRSMADTAWEVVEDATLSPGDCVVETAMGRANFGFEAQLAEVEQTLQRLMSQRRGAD
jgi:flagellar assembly protein FliH